MKRTKASRRAASEKGPGRLLIIGGAEDKSGEMKILRRLIDLTSQDHVVVATTASEIPMEVWAAYQKAFRALGVKDVRHLLLQSSEEARDPRKLKILDGARTVLFSGGDQLRITSKIGGTPIADKIKEIFATGGVIAGTSAGASVMGEAMLVGGENQESHKVGNWMMAPGLGFVHEMIIDQHFAQRGRIGRLLGAVALNPGVLGLGIDENTAVLLQNNELEVIGENAVYVVDGRQVSYTNISEAAAERTMSMHNVRLHILSEGDRFDLKERRPSQKDLMNATLRSGF